MFLKPRLFPTLFTLCAVIILVLLGTWQVHRLQWKLGVIEKVEHSLSLPAYQLDDADLNELNIDHFQYRVVKMHGRFLHEDEHYLYFGEKIFKGEVGFLVLTPLILANGQVILVDRGWVPKTLKDPVSRPDSLVKGEVEVTGMLHKGEVPGWFTPENDPDRNLWFWIDVPDMLKSYSNNGLTSFYIRALAKQNQADFPVPGEKEVKYRNDHLQYAVIWYSLAIILIVIYVLYHFRRQ